MFDPSDILPEKPRRLTRGEYDVMVDAGLFRDERVELLHGVVIEMSPQGSAHAFVVAKLVNLLAQQLAGRAFVHGQAPLALTEDSEPEPDVYLTPIADFSKAHPTTAWLIVEVSLSSVQKDKGIKANLYAVANQPEYWLVDVENRCVLAHRAPKNGRYTDIRSYQEGESLTLIQFPDLQVPVASILPSR
jgi:Uma2 family endonuclease